MDVFLRVDINIMAMVLLGLVSLNAYKRLDRQDSLNRVFLIVSLIIIVQLFFETVTCIINKRPEQWLVPMSVFLHICLFAVAPILTYYWYFLIKNLVVSDEAAVKKSNIILLVPVVISILFTLLSPVYNFVFFIDSSNVYHRGPFFNINAAITYFYILYGFILIVINRSKIVKQEFVPLCMFSVLPLIGGLVQTLFYGTLLMWSGTAYSLVIVYIFLQQRMVHLDALTGVWNRGSFDYYISQRLKQKNNDKFGVIYFDIDGLKNINDSYGHVEGDLAIKTSIAIIQRVIRKNDIIVRMGGDEFLIILDCESNVDLEKTINRINASFSEHNKNSGKSYKLECSFGADIYSSEYSSIEQFLRHVDNLMYENKREKMLASC
ncbi:diguanylate cyclase domain-containing protein [Pelotomaculum propionicicum]|uniref:GGDEF domain-containing protein n=1 Tax=Pelotomaculum propionicicum TaxID=258475 RepID=UPI003B7CD90B